MSRASDYAAAVDVAESGMDQATLSAPPPWTSSSGLTASVTPEGELLLDRTVTLPHDEAVSLCTWLQATFT